MEPFSYPMDQKREYDRLNQLFSSIRQYQEKDRFSEGFKLFSWYAVEFLKSVASFSIVK